MITLSIKGMTCSSCADQIKKAVKAIDGVWTINISYPDAMAEIETVDDIKRCEIVDAIEALGYTCLLYTSPSPRD